MIGRDVWLQHFTITMMPACVFFPAWRWLDGDEDLDSDCLDGMWAIMGRAM
jgi:hypothetical protein